MSDEWVRLVLKGLVKVNEIPGLHLLVLSDVKDERHVDIPIDGDALALWQFYQQPSQAEGPNLVKVLGEVLRSFPEERFAVYVKKLKDTKFLAYVENQTHTRSWPIDIYNAILLSQLTVLPIYINIILYLRQSWAPKEAPKGMMALSLNVLTEDMLRGMLDKLIAQEDYEHASSIQDELKRRKKKQSTKK